MGDLVYMPHIILFYVNIKSHESCNCNTVTVTHASRVSTESTVVCCCHGYCFQRGEKWSAFRVAVC